MKLSIILLVALLTTFRVNATNSQLFIIKKSPWFMRPAWRPVDIPNARRFYPSNVDTWFKTIEKEDPV
ncbi:unnamed protein product [Dracunculus medinensis]|uniref:Spondin domain-containing protein n=1 Tax=Dracunculus medinensis TaxID=318479 RepID=A0A0N4U8V6_DRAME|nr:unnamed protein product [Dracunculus medinensis]